MRPGKPARSSRCVLKIVAVHQRTRSPGTLGDRGLQESGLFTFEVREQTVCETVEVEVHRDGIFGGLFDKVLGPKTETETHCETTWETRKNYR